ncbi:MAG: 30S ribosomal protein S6, partial [Bacteroidota bacterium]
MDKPTRIYETTVILNASLDDSQTDGVIGRIQDLIVKNGGAVSAVNKWGRKRLSYPIRKKTNGFYVNIEFTAPAPFLTVLERAYQLDEVILRHLTIAPDRKALAARPPRPAEPPPPAPAVREPLFKG